MEGVMIYYYITRWIVFTQTCLFFFCAETNEERDQMMHDEGRQKYKMDYCEVILYYYIQLLMYLKI